VALFLFACGDQESIAQANRQNSEPALPKVENLADAQPAKTNQIYQEGKHYFRIGEPTRNEHGKVEVVEVFWFGCGHCFATEPYIESWDRNKSQDAELVRVAAPLSGIWGFHAQVYYANKALGIAEQVHQATFNAIHRDGLRLSSLNQVADFYAENFGVDAEEYKNAFNSFSVNLELNKARELVEQYRINSVPNFMVGGAYRVNAESAGSIPGIFSVINYLLSAKFQ